MLAIVRTQQSTLLPGGGLEGNETPERAIEREAREECGFAVRVGRWSVRAIQRAYSAPEKTHFEKPSTFCDARVTRRGIAIVELDHELLWVTHAEARVQLSHESSALGGGAVGRTLRADLNGSRAASRSANSRIFRRCRVRTARVILGAP